MTSLVLAILLTQAVDTPLKDSTPAIPRPALVVYAGMTVPYNGVLLDDAQAVHQAKRLAAAEASLAAVEGKTLISTPVLVGGLVAVVAVAFAAGAATAYAVRK